MGNETKVQLFITKYFLCVLVLLYFFTMDRAVFYPDQHLHSKHLDNMWCNGVTLSRCH